MAPSGGTHGDGLTDGDAFGVVGDSTLAGAGGGGGGGRAPHGVQYFMMEDSDGFAYVKLDAVPLGGRVTQARASAWVYLADTVWERSDSVRVWVAAGNGTADSTLFGGSGVDVNGLVGSAWREYSANVTGRVAVQARPALLGSWDTFQGALTTGMRYAAC